jgi:mersacidin/lichenicidin family type 2 lantibiotic
MSRIDIIRAWKDEEYRLGLTDAQRALLPDHPAGLIELDEGELAKIMGAGSLHTCPPTFYCNFSYGPVPCG